MQELAEIEWGFLIPTVFSLIALLISGAAYQNSRSAENTRRKEKVTTAMAECHRIIEEIIRMHPPNALEPHPGRVWVYRANEVEEINKRADELNELSWSCKEYGESIRDAVSILKKLISKPNEDVDKKWLSSEIESLVKIRDGILST